MTQASKKTNQEITLVDAFANITNASVDKRICGKIGYVLPDGWVVGPVSPDTGVVMSIEPLEGRKKGQKMRYELTEREFERVRELTEREFERELREREFGVSPPKGALESYRTWYEGRDHAIELCQKGHVNARLPTANELNALYNNGVKAGLNQDAGFNTNWSLSPGKYWSSTPFSDTSYYIRVQYFNNGFQTWHLTDDGKIYARCVRDEPGLKLA